MFHDKIIKSIKCVTQRLFKIHPKLDVLKTFVERSRRSLNVCCIYIIKNCSDCSVSQSVRPSADISALKESSRKLGNH